MGQGSFATHVVCHDRNVIAVAKNAPLELLGPLGCGVITGAGDVINSLKVGAGKSIAIFGTGSVGLSCILAKLIELHALGPLSTRKARQLDGSINELISV
jgi:aryl-alcohol dehydrogenase